MEISTSAVNNGAGASADMDIDILKTGNTHPDFAHLTGLLDEELARRYGKKQAGYDAHNKIDPVPTAVVGYLNGSPVACGCFKTLDDQCGEIKRMFVNQDCRRRGISGRILQFLEAWAHDMGYTTARIETGKGQPEAIGLYRKYGYGIIDNYGPYKGMENSVCLSKQIGSLI